MTQLFATLFARDLARLKDEILAFKSEGDLWANAPGTTNSAGNLTLHLLGNINHFIGATMGNTGYIRARDLEFSTKGTPVQVMAAGIDAAIAMCTTVLGSLTTEQLERQYPLEPFGPGTTAFYLTHFYGHLNYHLGQINYLRRILESK